MFGCRTQLSCRRRLDIDHVRPDGREGQCPTYRSCMSRCRGPDAVRHQQHQRYPHVHPQHPDSRIPFRRPIPDTYDKKEERSSADRQNSSLFWSSQSLQLSTFAHSASTRAPFTPLQQNAAYSISDYSRSAGFRSNGSTSTDLSGHSTDLGRASLSRKLSVPDIPLLKAQIKKREPSRLPLSPGTNP